MLQSGECSCPFVMKTSFMKETQTSHCQKCVVKPGFHQMSFIGAKGWGLRTVVGGELGPRVSEPEPAAVPRGEHGGGTHPRLLCPPRAQPEQPGPGRPPGLGPACGDHQGQGWAPPASPASSTLRQPPLFPCRYLHVDAAGRAFAAGL